MEQISSNLYHSSAITSTGEIYTCGNNVEGEVQPAEEERCTEADNQGIFIFPLL
jgi:alpha-tubulin suppressor-like RCC1 family protein